MSDIFSQKNSCLTQKKIKRELLFSETSSVEISSAPEVPVVTLEVVQEEMVASLLPWWQRAPGQAV